MLNAIYSCDGKAEFLAGITLIFSHMILQKSTTQTWNKFYYIAVLIDILFIC